MSKRTYISDPGDKTGRRFTGKLKRDPATVWALPEGHAVITERRTMFPSTVVSALDSQRLLISGPVRQSGSGSDRDLPWEARTPKLKAWGYYAIAAVLLALLALGWR